MKFAVFALFCVCASVLARPSDLNFPHEHNGDGGEHEETHQTEELQPPSSEGDNSGNDGGAPAPEGDSPPQEGEPVKIIKYDSEIKEDGGYTLDLETEDGIVRTENGTPGEDGAIYQEGKVSFKFPDGEVYEMTFTADNEGYKPVSSWIPVNPHPIPDFVLQQIEKAKQEDEGKAQEGREDQETETQAPSDDQSTNDQSTDDQSTNDQSTNDQFTNDQFTNDQSTNDQSTNDQQQQQQFQF